MAQLIGLMDGTNVDHDYHFSAADYSMVSGGIIGTGDLLVTSGSVAAGEALIECVRTNGQKVLVHYQNTAAVAVTTSGTTKIYVLIDQTKLDNGSGNAVDGSGIGAITSGASYPAGNYIPLASITGGVITDARVRTRYKGKDVLGRMGLARSAAIASASTTDLSTADGNTVHITGTTTINSFGTVTAGTTIDVIFDGALTLTYNATSMILPSGASIITAPGDSAQMFSEGSGNWRCMSYLRANGTAVVSTIDIAGQTAKSVGYYTDLAIIADSQASNAIRKVPIDKLFSIVGDGSDGDVTVSTTITLVRDMYYNNLTVNSPGIINTDGYKIFVRGTLSGNGTIRAIGNAGGNGGGGGAGGSAGAVPNAGTLNAGVAGVAGGSGIGTAGTSQTLCYHSNNGVAGGAAGNGTAGGAAGTTTRGADYQSGLIHVQNVLSQHFHRPSFVANPTQYKVSAGSGAGGGGTGVGGGGGGSGSTGGCVFIVVNTINFSGTISVLGGTGGDGGGGGSNAGGGGGGGGNGGTIIIFYVTLTASGTKIVTGGNGGAPGTGIPAGSAGANGNVGVTLQIQIT